jgi:hypothetical protein
VAQNSSQWCQWIDSIIQGGYVGIKVNDHVDQNFQTKKGLWHKINYHKSEIFCYGEAKEVQEEYSNIFGCQCGTYPFKYLGIPMHYKRLSNNYWKMIEQRIEKKLSSWKAKHLSVGGRLVLINYILTSLVMFMLSFFEVLR